jgi:hypothetical protein
MLMLKKVVDVLQILHVKWLDGENIGSAKLAV